MRTHVPADNRHNATNFIRAESQGQQSCLGQLRADRFVCIKVRAPIIRHSTRARLADVVQQRRPF